MMGAALKNPFAIYIIAFASVIALYQLGWSDLYPALSWDLLLFFALTFLSAFLLARLISPFVSGTRDYEPGLLSGYATLFVIATFAGEVWLARGVPLLFLMRGVDLHSIEASHLHAFTFWSAFSAIRFADFLYSRRYRFLAEAALPLIFYLLLVYRGPAIMCVLSWIFVFVIRHNGLRRRHVAWAAAGLLALFYLNGVLGDLRSPGEDVSNGAPSASFRNSGIPRTYFWTYLYATSPLANFQLSVRKLTPGQGTVPEFVATELLPDTIAKRILPLLNDSIGTGAGNLASRNELYSWKQPQISSANISTLFGRSYGYFGWLGPVIMFAVLSAFIVIYSILIRSSPYRVPALALLNVLVVFCLFNNMIASAAMLPQLVWPLLLPPWTYRKQRGPASSNPPEFSGDIAPT
jgi:hypothetical protein